VDARRSGRRDPAPPAGLSPAVLALAAAAALALLPAPPAAALGADVPRRDIRGYEAISSSAEGRGDADAMLAALVAAIARDPGGEGAGLALLRLEEVRSDASDPRGPTLTAALERIAAEAADPDDRDRARRVLSRVRAEAGDWDGARRAEAARGTIRRWLVAGPFGFTPRALHDRSFGPEAALRARAADVGELFDGASGKVGWRGVALGPLATGLRPSSWIQPQSGCAYALAQLRAPRGSEALVAIASAGSFKAWWNGAPIADVDRSLGYAPGRALARIVFGDGTGRLLVKCDSAYSEVEVRVVAARGGPLEGLEVAAGDRIEPLGADPGRAEALPAPAVPEGARGFARAAAALRLADLGLVSEALPHLEKAADEEPRSAHLAFLAARVLEDADHIPEARRTNEARAWVEKALARDARFMPALERKARFLDTDGKPERSFKELRALARESARFTAARRAAIYLARRQGWEAEAIEEMEALAASPVGAAQAWPHLLLAEQRLRGDDRRRALEGYRLAHERDRGAPWIEERIATLAREQGAAEEAEAILRRLAERYPDEPLRLEALAEAARARGDVDAAVGLLARSAEMRGGEPDVHQRIGDVLVAAGRGGDAAPWLARALAREPGRFATRRQLALLRGEEWDFARPYRVDVGPLIAAAPGAEKHPKAHTICLLDETVTRIHADGSKVDVVHQVFKLLDDAGVERYHTLRIPGEPLELRTIGVDGKVYEPIITDSTSEILMPKLEPGAVIDYGYRMVSSRPPPFQFDAGQFYFKDPQLSEPFERSRYVVIVDDGFDLETISRNMPSPPSVERVEGGRVFTWEVRDSDRVDQEPLMPERDEILPSVQLLGRRSWEDVAEVLRERFIGRTRLTPELRAKAAEATAGAEGDAAKARRLYDFVLDHVRGDFGGDEASEIFLERAGTRTVLLRALLDAAGVPSRFALCAPNPRLSEVQVWDPPRPELFVSSALVVEPRDGPPVWVVDGGRFLPYGLVPDSIQGGQAILISRSGGELRTVPETPVEETMSRSETRIRLEGRGGTVASRSVVLAPGGYQFKDRVATASKAQLRNFVEAQVNQVFRGARLESFDFPGVDRPGVPFTLETLARVEALLVPRDEALALRTGLAPLDLLRTLGGKPERAHPLLVRMRQAQEDVVEVDLGGHALESLPRDLLLAERFATYSLAYEHAEGRLVVRRRFTLIPSRIEREEYGSVLRFCREVDAAERKWIHLRERS
jgi:hypothetical protein